MGDADGRGPQADEEYFQAIESRFAQLRGTPLLLSTRDVALVDEWWRAGVPLRVVLGAIERVFERRRASGDRRPPPVLSLSYCRHAVDEALDDWKESRLGAGAEATDVSPAPDEAAALLEARAAELGSHGGGPALQAAAEAVAALAARLRSTAPPALAAVEEDLAAVEDRLIDGLLVTMPRMEREALESRVDVALAGLRSRLTERAYRTSREGQLRAEVRACSKLPRLTLYVL